MSPVVFAPLVLLVMGTALALWVVAQITTSISALRAELTVLAQLAGARDLLGAEVSRARTSLGATMAPNGTFAASADVWPPAEGR